MSLLKLEILKKKDALHIEFEVQKIKMIGVGNPQMDMNSEPESVVIVDSVTTALMNRHDRYLQLKQSEKYGNHQQVNAIVALSKEHRWGVHTSAVSDYTDMFQSLSDLLWEVDLHYSKFVAHGGRFPSVVEDKLLKFRKQSKHATPKFDIQVLLKHITNLTKFLELRFMRMLHMKLMEFIVSGVLKR